MPDSNSLKKTRSLDNWIAINDDGRILVRTGKVDIGQRISTALALIVSEELDVDIDNIDISRTETGVDPDEGITSGSNSMEESGNAGRAAAATARQHLIALAAEAAEEEPRASIIAAPLFCTTGMKVSLSHSSSPITSLACESLILAL